MLTGMGFELKMYTKCILCCMGEPARTDGHRKSPAEAGPIEI